jgi:hypothetical protein
VDWAVRALPSSVDEVIDEVARGADDDEDDYLSDEEEFAALVDADWGGRVDAARIYLDNGLEHWGRFTYEASKQFHRGLLHRQRAAPRRGVDDARRWFRRQGSMIRAWRGVRVGRDNARHVDGASRVPWS